MESQRRKLVFVELDGGDRVASCQQLFAHCVEGEDVAASVEGVEDEDREGKRTRGKEKKQKAKAQHGDHDFLSDNISLINWVITVFGQTQ